MGQLYEIKAGRSISNRPCTGSQCTSWGTRCRSEELGRQRLRVEMKRCWPVGGEVQDTGSKRTLDAGQSRLTDAHRGQVDGRQVLCNSSERATPYHLKYSRYQYLLWLFRKGNADPHGEYTPRQIEYACITYSLAAGDRRHGFLLILGNTEEGSSRDLRWIEEICIAVW
ncbi:hypothetical protein GQ43DRAFT_18246 [Delitschia confertaspora ATCC 74209]|uniref:Uncharacterized protein n=1 Tax=Delitschia confertaspora ATCC 74209 TaxID=1513339 RepID=A0A9P4JMN5_9PLEO|nr:hypothetical protein GQ43DRAFT_18246 [Delitschia confertaspora ATCC 74209]